MGLTLSYSACEKYLLSPFSWYLHYLLKLRPVGFSSALVFGGAVDEGVNSLLTDMKNNIPVNVPKAKTIFENALAYSDNNDIRIKGTVKFSKADCDEDLLYGLTIPEEHDRAWYSLREKGIIMIDAYVSQVLPKIKQVHLVQHNINLTNADGDSFIGIVDLVATLDDGKTYVLDNKTSSKKYELDSVSESEQLATYFEALKSEYTLFGAGYIVLPKSIRKKKEPKCEIQIILGKIEEELIAATFAKYDGVLYGIKNGKFECTGECAKQFWGCTYSRFCKSNGKDMTGLRYKK